LAAVHGLEGLVSNQQLGLALDPGEVGVLGPTAVACLGQGVVHEDARPLALVLVHPFRVQIHTDDRRATGLELRQLAQARRELPHAHAERRGRRGSTVGWTTDSDSSRRLARKYFFGRRRRSLARSISLSARRSSASNARSKAWRGVAARSSACTAARPPSSTVSAQRIPTPPFGPFSSLKPTRTATGGRARWPRSALIFLPISRRKAGSARPSITMAMRSSPRKLRDEQGVCRRGRATPPPACLRGQH